LIYNTYIISNLLINLLILSFLLIYFSKNFKCNGFNKWYETLTVFPWVIPSYDPSFDDVTSVNK